MNNNVSKLISASESDLYTSLARVVNKKNIINMGIITKVIDENFVNVKLYCSDTDGTPIIISSVRLLHIGTAKCKINIQPAVGDSVLLLGNRDFIEKLEYQHEPKEKEATIEPYNNTTIQGILISPEGRDDAKVTIKINEEGNVSLSTEGAIDVSSEQDINISAKGNITAECEGDLSVEAKGNATVKSQNTKLTGGIVEIGGSVTPNGQGALCGLPFCAYSGAPQTGKQTQGA